MLNYGVYIHIPGSFHIIEHDGLWIVVRDSAITYTLYRSGSDSKDFISNTSLNLEVNKSGSFQFSISPSHTYYSMLRRYIHYISVEDLDDHEVLFYGRIYSISMGFDGEKNVTAEGIMSNLLDCPVYNPTVDVHTLDPTEIFKMEGTPDVLFRQALAAYRNFIRPDISIGQIFAEASTLPSNKIDVSNGQTVGDFIISELVESAGGYVVMDYEKDESGNIQGILEWEADPSFSSYNRQINSQDVEFGVNLLDIDAEFSDDDIVTGVIPTWTDENNEKHWAIMVGDSVDNPGSQMLKPYSVNGMGGSGIGIQMFDLPELSSQSEAITVAQRYATKYCSYNLSELEFDSFTVKAVDMHYFGNTSSPKFKICDRIHIKSDYHGLNNVYTCTAMEINPENPSENTYTLSIYRPKASSNDKLLCRQLGIKENKKRKVHNE